MIPRPLDLPALPYPFLLLRTRKKVKGGSLCRPCGLPESNASQIKSLGRRNCVHFAFSLFRVASTGGEGQNDNGASTTVAFDDKNITAAERVEPASHEATGDPNMGSTQGWKELKDEATRVRQTLSRSTKDGSGNGIELVETEAARAASGGSGSTKAHDESARAPEYSGEYKVYKRRWFGLVQLTLLNIIVSWDVSIFTHPSPLICLVWPPTMLVISSVEGPCKTNNEHRRDWGLWT